MKLGRSLLLAAASGALAAAWVGGAQAGAFGIREQSTIGLGESFAGAAAGSAGLSSMHWNPATITMYPGWTSEYNVTYIDPEARIRVLPPTPTAALGGSGDLGRSGTVPASFTAYQVNDRIWLGVAATAPFGLITKPNTFWAGQVYSRSSKVFSLAVSPIVGIKLTDWLSIGFGPTVEYFKTRLNSAAGVAPGAGQVILEGDDYSAGATVGATITPAPGTVIGVGYRTSIRHELDGTLRTPLAVIPARVALNLPDQLNVGLSQAITANFKVDLGFEWTNWSRLKLPTVVALNAGVPLAGVPLGYKDGYFFSVGGEYQIDSRWAVRAGVGYEISPIDRSNRGTRLPDTDRVFASLGATYRVTDKLEFNAAYSHIFSVGNRGIAIQPGNIVYAGLPFYGTVESNVNIFSVGARYRWDNPQVAEPAPIIRKY